MIAVTDLTSYLYCKRKLYFRKILGIKEKPKPYTIKGTIIHKFFEFAGQEDEKIICSFTEKESLDSLQMKFRSVYYKTLKKTLQIERKKSKDIDTLVLYQELWPSFLEEAKGKGKELFELAKDKKLYGEELWNFLPKASPEVALQSERLGIRGIIDRIEEGNVPVELKTGKPPLEGVRKEHMVQIGAYMMMLSEKSGRDVKEGFVEYSQIGEKRKVVMNPFLRDEVVELIEKVNRMLDGEVLPEKVKEERKCAVCGIREECFEKNS